MSYLIQGNSGTGKSWYARRAAYLVCERQIPFAELDRHVDSAADTDVARFFSSARCMHFQVNAATSFDDLVSTVPIIFSSSAQNKTSLTKPLLEFFAQASASSEPYAIIFEDIDRADTGVFFGPLIAALDNRSFPISPGSGHPIKVPDNVAFFFTAGCGDRPFQPPISFLSAMRGIKTLECSDSPLRRIYGSPKLKTALELATRLMSRTNQFIRSSQDSEHGVQAVSLQLGAGYFIVDTKKPVQSVLDGIRNKFKYSVDPLLRHSWRDGILPEDPSELLDSLEAEIDGEIKAESRISTVSKIAIRTEKEFSNWGPANAYHFLKNEVHAKSPRDFKPRDAMEAIIDAILGNGLLPLDFVFNELLTNQDVGWVENEGSRGKRAAYLLEKSEASDFVYLTPKNGQKTPHAFFSIESTSGWHSIDGPAGYRFSYFGSLEDQTFVPLNGFRKKSITINTDKLYDTGNAAVAYRSCYRLVRAYLSALESAYRRIADSNPAYVDLADYVQIEARYHSELHEEVRKNSRGEGPRFLRYCEGILELRSLWQESGTSIAVNSKTFERFRGRDIAFNDFTDLHQISSSQTVIEFREVLLMTQSRDYQAVMDSLNVRQLIFQGPPGTSKTFESKRFVLSQLDPSAQCLQEEYPDRDAIDQALSAFKLTSADYSNPSSSPALNRGGWDIVQFHPAYSYEDFIRGIQVTAQNGQPIYETVNRTFGNIAELAKVSYDKCGGVAAPKFYLLIDEINRADLATVFGELIYGLEYRGSKMTTPYAFRSVSQAQDSFEIEVSKNIYLIGTMNTADKSIGAMDYAIRRRFLFVDSPADRELVVHAQQSISNSQVNESIETLLFDATQYLFDSPTLFNDDYHRNDVRIGHTFFLRTSDKDYAEQMAARAAYQIVPILREYVRDGILYPVHEADLQSTGQPFVPPVNTDQINSIGEQLLFYATNMGEPFQGAIISERTVTDYILSVCNDLGL